MSQLEKLVLSRKDALRFIFVICLMVNLKWGESQTLSVAA